VLNPLTLFSRKPSVGPAGGANLGVGGPGGTLRFFGSGGDNGFDASGFVELANQARDVLNATVTALGGQFGTTRGQLNAIGSFASRGGVFTTVQTHGSQPLDANGPSDITRFFGGDTNAAINDLLIRTFKNFEIIGVAPEVRSAIVNSVATTWEAFLDDLNFAAALAGVEFNAPEITAAEQAIAAINEQFAELAGRATALGIATAQLEAARERALADLTEGFDASIAAQILAFTDPAHGAMDALIAAQEARLREAEALGADLVEVERLAGLERTRLVAATLGDINALLSELTVGALSQATPAARLDAARTAFEEARALALAGETVADLAATVRAFIETSRAVQATGGTFGGDIGAAIDLLEQLQGQGFAHGGIARGPSLFGEAGPEAAIPLDSGMRIPVAEVRLGGAVDQGLRELVRLGETGRLNEEAGAALTRRLIGEIQGLRRDLRAAQPPRQVAA
jgi:hypothetical protein